MSFIRARQRVITALFPHQGNRTHIVPSRGPGPFVRRSIAKVSSMTLDFDRNVQGGDLLGFSLEINGTPEAVIAATNGLSNEIVVTFALQLVDDLVKVSYTRTARRGDVYPAGDFVRGFSRQGIIT